MDANRSAAFPNFSFKRAENMFSGIRKRLFQQGDKGPVHYPPISQLDLKKLFEYFKYFPFVSPKDTISSIIFNNRFSIDEPHGLLRYVWFLLQYFFIRRGREGLRELKKSHFIVDRLDNGQECLRMVATQKFQIVFCILFIRSQPKSANSTKAPRLAISNNRWTL